MIRGYFEPQTEAEWELLKDLHVVTRVAADEGVPKSRIASLTAFMAAAAAQRSAFEESAQKPTPSRERESEQDPESENIECPECGRPIRDMTVGMGLGQIEAKPCGCDLSDHDNKEQLYEEIMT